MPKNSLCVAFRTKDADIGKIPVIIGIVQTVADDKLIADLKAAEVGLVLAGMRAGLVEEGDGRDRRGLPCGEQLLEILHGQTGVDDVLDDHDVTAGDVVVKVLDEAHDAGRFGVLTVAGNGDEVHVNGAVHAAAEVDIEKGSALEHADEDGTLVAELFGQLSAELLHACGNGFFGKKDTLDVLFRRSDQHEKISCSA